MQLWNITQCYGEGIQEYKATAGYNEEGYISLLKRNLSPRVLERIYALENVPTTYDAWKTYAQHLAVTCMSTKHSKQQAASLT